MASRSEENLSCPVCREIFQEPAILSCSHSFCKACIQTWWTQNTSLVCPLCKIRSLHRDPPLNLALKNLCEDFLQNRTKRFLSGTEALCSLHNEKLKLFCLDDQQPVCVICLHSNTHNNHCIRPINEAAQDGREILRELLKSRQENLKLLNDVKGNFDQTAQDIEVQAQDTERQIKETFLMLQKLLKEEEQARINAVRKEKEQKIQTMKSKSEALNREIAALSDTVRATEEVLQAADLSFLQKYKTAAEIAQHSLPDVPQPMAGGLIDVTKHLNNLSHNILDKMSKKVTSNLNPRTVAPEPPVEFLRDRRLMRQPRQTSTDTWPRRFNVDTLLSQASTDIRPSQASRDTRPSQTSTDIRPSQTSTDTWPREFNVDTGLSQASTDTRPRKASTAHLAVRRWQRY